MENTNERIDFLINNLREDLGVEVKNWLDCLSTNDHKAKLAKEIIALGNNGGGFVFIGFEDDEPHLGIKAPEDWRRSFGQDAITSVVDRYISPPIQCDVYYASREGEESEHPVIRVPGNHRTPLFAKASSPNGKMLKTNEVYIRRPGGKSEPSRTQDDWEKLIDRLVKARQSDQLEAIRGILNPTDTILNEPESLDLGDWTDQCIERWGKILDEAKLKPDDGRRFENGYWHVSFKLSPFEVNQIMDLQRKLESGVRKFSGWPPFTYIHRDKDRPYPHDNSIEAWLGHDGDTTHADFWRVSKDGYGFLLRPMQEDDPRYGSNITPGPPRPVFDWVLPIYRMTEILHFLYDLGIEFGPENSEFQISVTYENTVGRTLWQSSFKYNLWERGSCKAPSIHSHISGRVAELGSNLNEVVWQLLSPIYAQFDFTELPKNLVDNVVAEVNSY